jgi:hypothetical protein
MEVCTERHAASPRFSKGGSGGAGEVVCPDAKWKTENGKTEIRIQRQDLQYLKIIIHGSIE